MSTTKISGILAQLRREFQEYRTSFLIAPAVIGGLIVLAVLLSVLFAGRLAFIGEGAMMALMHDPHESGPVVTITIEDEHRIGTAGETGDAGPDSKPYVVVEEPEAGGEEWNFSVEWTFGVPRRERPAADIADGEEMEGFGSLNPAMDVLHALFQVVLLFVSVNYLLGCLYQDRRDRSILFWKSMPVSEWREVLCKFAAVSLAAPLVYLAVSVATQTATLLLAMLLLWRLDVDPVNAILGNVEFIPLFRGQAAACLVWALSSAPVYAWFLVASAAARRSPFMFAFAIPIGLMFVERVFVGSNFLLHAITDRLSLPGTHGADAASAGIHLYGPVWSRLDYVEMALGLAAAGGFVALAVWLRRRRFEI